MIPSTHPLTILVIGATGLTGREVVRQALAAGHTVHAIVRNAGHGLPDKVKTWITPLDKMADFPEAFKVDSVVCTLGTTMKKAGSREAFCQVDVEYPGLAARTAAACGVEQFILVSATGAKSDSMFFYNRAKAEAEKAVRDSGVSSVVIIRPSLLMGNRQEQRTGEWLGIIAMRVLKPLLTGPFRRMRGVSIAALASTILRNLNGRKAGCTAIESEFILP